MSDNSEKIESRLENLQSIEPLVSSMRVLSMSNLQFAINRFDNLKAYKLEFIRVYRMLKDGFDIRKKTPESRVNPGEGASLLVLLGTDRGFCGTYNRQLIAMAERWLAGKSTARRLIAFGQRLNTNLRYAKLAVDDYGSIVRGTSPRYDLASELAGRWREDFLSGRLQSLDVLSFRKTGQGQQKPVITHFFPERDILFDSEMTAPDWPPPIIEGDRAIMIAKIEDHLSRIRFFELILESMIAENTIRFRILEEAKENTSALIDELALELQIEKRKSVTSQLQEISVSAGLTKSDIISPFCLIEISAIRLNLSRI